MNLQGIEFCIKAGLSPFKTDKASIPQLHKTSSLGLIRHASVILIVGPFQFSVIHLIPNFSMIKISK